MEKVKKISKYVMNFLCMINAIIIGLSPIWGWDLSKLTDSIGVLVGVIGAYLVAGKLFTQEEVQTTFNEDDLESEE